MPVLNQTFETADSGAFVTCQDANGATLAGYAVGAVTVGGCVAVGVTVLPGQVAAGVATTAALLAAGAAKEETGSFLPFLNGKEKAAPSKKTEAVVADDTVVDD